MLNCYILLIFFLLIISYKFRSNYIKILYEKKILQTIINKMSLTL